MNNYSPDVLPPVELPAPSQNNGDIARNTQEIPINIANTTEQGLSQALEQGVSAAAPLPPGPQSSNDPLPYQTQSTAMVSDPAEESAAGGLPVSTNDSGLIEKEWVIKSKEIIARTKSDPHMQTNEIAKIKDDYKRKRFNRDIKVSEKQ